MAQGHSIRREIPQDIGAIDQVHRDAFGPGDKVPMLVQRLRQLDAPIATRSLVAEASAGGVLGHVMLSHAWLDAPDRLVDVLVLSPLGVAKAAQRSGIGSALLRAAVEAAEAAGAPLVILEGSPKFYGPRGFEAATAHGVRSPSLRIPERALQMVRLRAHRPEMTGSLVYRDLWWELDAVGLRRPI